MATLDVTRGNADAQWLKNQSNLDRVFDPLNQASDRSLGITLADIAGQKEDAREARRIQGYADLAKQKKFLELAGQGVKVNKDMTIEQLADAEFKFKQNAAGVVLGIHRKDVEDTRKEYDKTYRELIDASRATASKEDKIAAARAMMLNPEALAQLKKGEIEEINVAIARNQDPEKIINAAAKRAGDSGWFSKHPERGLAIQSAFYTPLSASELVSKQTSVQAAAAKLNDVSQRFNMVQKGFNDAMKVNGPYLSEEKLKEFSTAPIDDATATRPGPDFGADPNVSRSNQFADEDAYFANQPAVPQTPNTGVIPTAIRESSGIQKALRYGRAAGAVARDALNTPRDVYRALISGRPATESTAGPIIQPGVPAGSINNADMLQYQKRLLDSQPPDIQQQMRKFALSTYGPDRVAEADSAIANADDPNHATAIGRAFTLLQAIWRERKGLPDLPPIQDEPMAPLPTQ